VNRTREKVYVGVDMKSVVGSNGEGRRSVRLESNKRYNSGLFIATLDHMPTGCGTWPALWLFGGDVKHPWPSWGEFDIIEGAHKSTQAMSTLHTASGCDQSTVVPGMDFTTRWHQGTKKAPARDCNVHADGQFENQGCSQAGPENSMGSAFNAFNGGTFAAEWDPLAGHIRSWFWPAGSEPFDVIMKHPAPSSWGKPFSYFRLDPITCPASHFQNMRIVLDLTLCGDYGEATFKDSCPEVLADNLSCKDFVLKHPEHMREAFWSIRSLDVYHAAGLNLGGSNLLGTLVVLKRFQTGALEVLSGTRTVLMLPTTTSWVLVLSVLFLALAHMLFKVRHWARWPIQGRGISRRELSIYSQLELAI